MRKDFNVGVWRNYYDQVNILGQQLKDARPDIDGNPPKYKLSDEERLKIEGEIAELLSMSDAYLDKCKIYPREPKWYYDRSNKRTWASSEKFAFFNLVSRRKYVTIRI